MPVRGTDREGQWQRSIVHFRLEIKMDEGDPKTRCRLNRKFYKAWRPSEQQEPPESQLQTGNCCP